MKKLPIAAAALLFGTSAYAMAASKDPDAIMGTTAVSTATDEATKLEPAAVDWWGAAPAATTAEAALDAEVKAAGKADVALAASDEFAATDAEWDAIAAAKADDESEVETALGPEAEPVSAETTVLDEAPVPVEDGVGGPEEAIDTAAAVSPQPAAQNYPACRPGPGDDRCIQLYEPGVQTQLASWDRPTGGFAGAGDTQVAMGGPYEPVADSATETERLNQQALADSASALQSVQMAAAEPAAADTAVAMGGPYEPVDATMNGDGTVDTAMGETEADEAVEV